MYKFLHIQSALSYTINVTLIEKNGGFMGLFDSMKENNDKRKKISKCKSDARDYVRKGNDKYDRKYEKVRTVAGKLSYDLYKYGVEKKEILKKIESEIQPTLHEFSRMDIDMKTIHDFEIPDDEKMSLSMESKSFSSLAQGHVGGIIKLPTNPVFDLFFTDIDDEYYEAMTLLNDAKSFYYDMLVEVGNLERLLINLDAVKSFIYDEKIMFKELSQRLIELKNILKNEMKETHYTEKRAIELKSIFKIATSMSQMLSMRLINEDFSINAEYMKQYKQLEVINNSVKRFDIGNENGVSDLFSLLDQVIVN